VYELIIDGVFAMDTVDVTSEKRLATETLSRLTCDGLCVVVGGLGLGFSLRAVLAEPRVRQVVVVELEPALVAWARRGLVVPCAGLLDDPRVEVVERDLAAWLLDAPAGRADAILLDVDNGPDFLVHRSNGELYQPDALALALRALRRGGLLAVWSADRSALLHGRLSGLGADVREIVLPVSREGRTFDYAIYLAGP
jgi:spermidine synthase